MFRFRLARVLEWEQAKCHLEEFRTGQVSASLNKTNSELAHLRADFVRGEREVVSATVMVGPELHALAAWRKVFRSKEATLEAARKDWERKLFEQRARWVQARRRCRLFESLRSRRMDEYEQETSRALEATASEAHLVRWSRREH